jgi:hypothetical protein
MGESKCDSKMLLVEELVLVSMENSCFYWAAVDAEDRSKPTHQRGPWMPKRSHKTCNAAGDEA